MKFKQCTAVVLTSIFMVCNTNILAFADEDVDTTVENVENFESDNISDTENEEILENDEASENIDEIADNSDKLDTQELEFAENIDDYSVDDFDEIDTTSDNYSTQAYLVPIKMVQAANPNMESMGNSALDGNATVLVGQDKSVVTINLKATNYLGLYGHLLNMWSYPTTDSMDYSWWNNSEYEIEGEYTQYFSDYGMEYPQGNTDKFDFIRSVRLERDAVFENSIFIRISVDAMAGFDQVARLDFDWDNAIPIENEGKIASAPTIVGDKLEADNSDSIVVSMSTTDTNGKIYYQINNGEYIEYSEPFNIYAPSILGGNVNIKAYTSCDGMIDSAISEAEFVFNPQKTELVAENKDLNIQVYSTQNTLDKSVDITSVDEQYAKNIAKASKVKAFNLDFALKNDSDNIIVNSDISQLDTKNLKLYYVDSDDNLIETKYDIQNNIAIFETNKSGTYIFANINQNSNNSSDSTSVEDGKYWMDISLYNANLDQTSMGDSIFDNNRQALVTISGGKATIEFATNPVAVSGYTSALRDITSTDANISIKSTSEFTTNTRFDGNTHTFNYATVVSMEIDDLTTEYVPVKISVPYTPMDNISANENGWLEARLKLNFSNLQAADSNASIKSDSTVASGSSGGGSSVSDNSNLYNIKIEADDYVFEDGTTFDIAKINDGNVLKATKYLFGDEYKYDIYSLKAVANGSETKPQGMVSIYFPIIKETPQNSVKIYRILSDENIEDSQKTELEYTLSDDKEYYVVKVKELGNFAIVYGGEEIEEELLQPVFYDTVVSDSGVVFDDLENHWAKDYCNKAIELGLFKGVSESKFAPDMVSSRAMIVTILGRLSNINTNEYMVDSFSDVDSSDYFYPYVAWAKENNITSGINDSQFSPYEPITREQLSTMIANYISYKNLEFKSVYNTPNYADYTDCSNWAVDSINMLSKIGILSGKENNRFEPKSYTTRAEVATVVVKLVEEIERIEK